MKSKVEFTLKEYLQSGNIGPIALGVTKNDLVAWLGDGGNRDLPRGTRGKKPRDTLWQFGSLEIGFLDDRITFLGFYFRTYEYLPSELVVNGYFPSKRTTMLEFEDYLRGAEITYDRDSRWNSERYTAIRAGIGVHAYFRVESKVIDSIQWAGPPIRRLV